MGSRLHREAHYAALRKQLLCVEREEVHSQQMEPVRLSKGTERLAQQKKAVGYVASTVVSLSPWSLCLSTSLRAQKATTGRAVILFYSPRHFEHHLVLLLLLQRYPAPCSRCRHRASSSDGCYGRRCVY